MPRRDIKHKSAVYQPAVAVLLAVPIAYLIWLAFLDRTPPLILYDGRIEPSVVHLQQWQRDTLLDRDGQWAWRNLDIPNKTEWTRVNSEAPAPVTNVKWRAHFSGRDCPGQSQREIVDVDRNLWPKLIRERRGVFTPDPGNPYEGTVTTPSLTIPTAIAQGPAYYQVTQFYYCNWLQRKLNWPIVQVSPPVDFRVAK